MANNALQIDIPDIKKFNARFAAAPAVVSAELNKLLLNIAIDMQRAAVQHAPVDTARLQSAIRIVPGNLTYRVEPQTQYAYYAHEGRKPGRVPPVESVRSWAERRGLNPFLVARAIGIKGTKGVKFLDMAFNENEASAKAKANATIVKIVEGI